MKHIWTLSLLFLLLSGTKTLAQEATPLQVKITTTDDLRVHLNAQNNTGKKLILCVWMRDQSVASRTAETKIYSEEIAGNTAEVDRMLNLSSLESGTYRISLKAGKEHVTQWVDIRPKPVVDESRVILLQ